MDVELLSVGTELLLGEIVDTNAAYLAKKLSELGINVYHKTTVGDNRERLAAALRISLGRSDTVFATGGLGPTEDDVTAATVAQVAGVDLVADEAAADSIRSIARQRGLKLLDSLLKQARVPRGATVIPNPVGTAPGFILTLGGEAVIALPGVPAEMKRMFHEQLKDHLRQLAGGQGVAASKLMCYGTGESAIATMLGDRMERGRNPLVNTTADVGVVTVHIVAAGENWPDAERLVEEERGELCKLLGDIVYGFDGQTLAEVAGSLLLARGRTLAVAESCTGGLLGKLITDVPGSSDYFRSGWVTYSNEAKVRDLDVDPEILQRDGAVSEAVACAMAEGARKRAGTEYALAITGIAGPGGGSEAKPAGLVYVALAAAQHCRCQQFIFHGDRQSVRRRSALAALDMLRLQLVN